MTSFKRVILSNIFIPICQVLIAQNHVLTNCTPDNHDFKTPSGMSSITIECLRDDRS